MGAITRDEVRKILEEIIKEQKEQSQINTIENTTEERVKMYCYDMRISTDERERR